MCLLIFLFLFDLDNSVLFGLDKKPPVEFFFLDTVMEKIWQVSKRIQILNRQFNTLNSNANFYFNYVAFVYYANVSNINCWLQSERDSVQFLDA